jgi:hypothetical protein
VYDGRTPAKELPSKQKEQIFRAKDDISASHPSEWLTMLMGHHGAPLDGV